MSDINILDELADFVFVSKYAKYDESKKRRETWDETVDRVRDMHLKKFKGKLKEEDYDDIFKAFDFVKDKLVIPSMRSMQFGGKAVEAHNARIFNCLDKRTKFITSEGVRDFTNFNNGDTIKVLTKDGSWQQATVKSYGIQKLYKYSINRCKSSYDIWATENHRWYLSDGSETTTLKVGDKLLGAFDIFNEFDFDTAIPEEKLYWAYGYVYGDGTKVSERYSMVRLCGDQIKYENRFLELGFKTSSCLSIKGDIIAFTGKYLKTPPNPKIDNPSLIRAFVAGYLAADGEKNKNIDSNNKYLTIQASDPDHISFIRECFPVAGVYIVSETDLTGQETNYGKRPFTIKFRIFNHPNNNINSNTPFVVKDKSSSFTEDEVWCLEVENSHNFTLPNGLVTGNCAVRHIDSIRSFAEVFYLLLCGCGVGIGLVPCFLDRLPDLVNEDDKTGSVLTYCCEDSIEGWADSVQALLNCYFKNTAYSGRKIVFDYSKIRRKGAKLKTGGGKAPGYKGLKASHIKIKKLLDHIIEDLGQVRLKSINAYDILMHCADAVLSGGIRRAATSVVFDKNDIDMMEAKTGNWFEDNPQRARSNNSVILLRKDCSKEEFKSIIERTKQFGEPGFVFSDHKWTNYNPCFEIGFIPVTEDGVCGVQFCNLTSQNGKNIKTKEDFKKATWAATLIGTLQATYTDFPYLGHVAEKLTREEALLGVSITGMMENPDILLNPEIQKEMSEYAVEVNKIWAKKLCINPAARVTCIKPEGTSTLALGSPCSGIHAGHGRKHFRRIQCNKLDNVYKYFASKNPHMVEESVWSANKTDDIITFPIEVGPKVIIKSDLDAIKHLEIVKNTQQNWVLPGANSHKKKVTHNVSCTVIVKEEEWPAVIDYLYENKEFFSATSFLASTGDKDYKQAPLENITTEEDEIKFNYLRDNFIHVDYTAMIENDDHTTLKEELSCAGGKCEL